jgi:membrane-associated protease RseP (regulator of RpoE activity)
MTLFTAHPTNPDEALTTIATGIRDDLAEFFACTQVQINSPQPGAIRLKGQFHCDLAQCYDEIRGRVENHGFTPLIREEEEQTYLIAIPVLFKATPTQWWINLLLFIATILTTLLVGMEPAWDGATLPTFSQLLSGWPFSLSLLLILGSHELGHYFAARYHKVPVTLPYFIPMPISYIGTMGAMIRLKAPIKNKRALLDIGAAGPLTGLVFAIPILLYGLYTSPIIQLPINEPYRLEGNSILYLLAKLLVFGQILPSPEGLDVSLNNVAWAGWVGLLITGLNLLPLGQLDGGHIAYALFGKQAKTFYWPILITLMVLMFLTDGVTWGFWILLLFFFGRVHAEPLDDVTPLDSTRRSVALFTLVLFFLVFVAIPFTFKNMP